MKRLLYFIFGTSVIFSCKVKEIEQPLPISEFEWKNNGNGEIVFINNSKFADSFEWSLGDSTIKNEKEPTHIYKKNGKFKVILKAFNAYGSNFSSKEIAVSNILPPPLKILPSGLFSFKIIPQEDGKVLFTPDSTQKITEYMFNFGSGNIVKSNSPKVFEYVFPKNGIFEVSLLIKNETNEVSETKIVKIENKLAKVFSDLSTDFTNKINILHIICGKGTFDIKKELENDPLDYLDKSYQYYIKNHSQSHQKEFNDLTFKHFYLKINSADSAYISTNKTIFLYNGGTIFNDITTPRDNIQKAIFDKILTAKKEFKTSITVFWIPFEIAVGSSVAGYASSPGNISVIDNSAKIKDQLIRINNFGRDVESYKNNIFRPLLITLAHELGHNFGMPHDNKIEGRQIMQGMGTEVLTGKVFLDAQIPLFQIKNHTPSFLITYENKPNELCCNREYAASGVLEALENETIKSYNLKKISYYTGLQTSGELTFFDQLTKLLIQQYNLGISPDKFLNIRDDLSLPKSAKLNFQYKVIE